MKVEPRTCPSAEVLTAYGLGKLNETDLAAIARHLEGCQSCREAVANVRADSFVGRVPAAQPIPSGTHLPGQPAGPLPSSAIPPNRNAVMDLPPELAQHPKFRILKELGRGGMGVVYQAEHRFMEMTVALKVINQTLLDNSEALERFDREIRAAARLVHPHIVRALDAEQAGELRLLVMEYVQGASLHDVLKQKGPLPLPHACHYIRQAALGLQHAHEQGMVHRDIKPHNLILTPRGQVKILDFGLARLASEQKQGRAGLTRSGDFMGTPEYIAPEQATDASQADIRADLYSLGCTLYALLTGRPPFQEGTAVQLVLAHLQKEAPPLNQVRPDVPTELATVVARLLAKEPAQRFQTPLEIAQLLAPFCKAGQKPNSPSGGMKPSPLPAPNQATVLPASISRLQRSPATGDQASGPVPPSLAQTSPFAELGPADHAPEKGPRHKPLPTGKKRGWVLGVAGACVLLFGLVALWAGGVFKVKTRDGVLVVEVNEPSPEVYLDGEKVTVSWGAGKQAQIKVKLGTHKVVIQKDGFTAFAKEVAVEEGGRLVIAARLEKSAPPAGFKPPTDGLILRDSLGGQSAPSIGRQEVAQGVWAAPGRSGRPGKAIEVRGNTSRLVYSVPSFPRSDYTLLLWVRLKEPPGAGKRQIWSGWRVQSDDPLRIVIEGGLMYAKIETATAYYGTGGVPFQMRCWMHIGVVKAGEKLTLYLNGKPVAWGKVPATITSTASHFALGRNPFTREDESLHASFSDLRLYSKALSAETISQFAAEQEANEPNPGAEKQPAAAGSAR